MKKVFSIFLCALASIFLGMIIFSFTVKAPVRQDIVWGANFSQMYAENLGLDWKKMYLALMEDLGVKHIKLLAQWDWVEGARDEFYFKDNDWQIEQAKSHGVELIYTLGMKTGRWPECHVPGWATTLSKEDQQEEILYYIAEVVKRYKKSTAIVAWQAENEPLFNFGECPWYDKEFLKVEVALIKSLDATRPVIISDSGEQSLWWQAAKIGDIVGTTMYRKSWVHITDSIGFYMDFPLPPASYWIKSELVKHLFGKKVINVELQVEPWLRDVGYATSIGEQEKTMDIRQFQKNIAYAKQSGFDEFYLWGVEWMYWLKEGQGKPEIWNEAKKIFTD